MKGLIAFILGMNLLVAVGCGDFGCDPGDVDLYGNCVSICNEHGNWETACF